MSVIVSISCTTYNHEKFIRDCLDGFLMQKTNFDFEILINDDASTDHTKLIIEEYRERHPDKILPIYQKENQYSKGVRGMMARFNFPRARGKYIALCEGDDYWTDPYKLQKQVDFLEENQDHVLCFHKVKVLNTDGRLVDDTITEPAYDNIQKRPLGLKELIENHNFIHTPSVLLRNLNIEFPFEFFYSPLGDYFIYCIWATHGYLARIDEVMGVYRHGVGIFSAASEMQKNKFYMKFVICLMAYMPDKESKEFLLKRCLYNIDRNYVKLDAASLATKISFGMWLKILIHKIRRLFFKNA